MRGDGAATWLARRIGGGMAVWLLISVLAFGMGALAPGDPAELMLLRRTGDVPSDLEVRALRHELGLDRPILARYGAWVGSAVHGDLGTSFRTGQSVSGELTSRFPATLSLAITALCVGLLIAVPLALGAVLKRDGAMDHATRIGALAGLSVPTFLLGYLLMLLFAVTLGVLPVAGHGGVRHLVLPALTLGIGGAASLTRMLRANLLEELAADYVLTARAKGLDSWHVLARHALRNALNPIVTVSALRFGRLLGEAVIVETVFAWPGVGRWMVESIYDRDYPAIQGFVLYIATVFVIINLGVDVSYHLLDPRVRVAGARAA